MGVVYQAVVIRAERKRIVAAVAAHGPGPKLLPAGRGRGLSVVDLQLGPGRTFADTASGLAAGWSRLGPSLLASYDDRIGLRQAVLYADGEPGRVFGLNDELWSPLDDHGDPRADAPRVRVREFEPGEEYDCAASAIDLGLVALGANPPLTAGRLRDMILKADQ